MPAGGVPCPHRSGPPACCPRRGARGAGLRGGREQGGAPAGPSFSRRLGAPARPSVPPGRPARPGPPSAVPALRTLRSQREKVSQTEPEGSGSVQALGSQGPGGRGRVQADPPAPAATAPRAPGPFRPPRAEKARAGSPGGGGEGGGGRGDGPDGPRPFGPDAEREAGWPLSVLGFPRTGGAGESRRGGTEGGMGVLRRPSLLGGPPSALPGAPSWASAGRLRPRKSLNHRLPRAARLGESARYLAPG